MKIILPKTSGFCYGVYLAVKEAENIIEGGKGLIMYGELVHNPDVVAKLEEKGGCSSSKSSGLALISLFICAQVGVFFKKRRY